MKVGSGIGGSTPRTSRAQKRITRYMDLANNRL
jgi:hypothetical protein